MKIVVKLLFGSTVLGRQLKVMYHQVQWGSKVLGRQSKLAQQQPHLSSRVLELALDVIHQQLIMGRPQVHLQHRGKLSPSSAHTFSAASS